MRNRLLHRYAAFALRRPWVLVGIAAALCAVSAFLVPQLTIVTARSKQIREDHPYMTRLQKFVLDFGGVETLIVLARCDDPARTKRFLDDLGLALGKEREDVRGAFHRLDLQMLAGKALLYLPTGVLRGLRDALAQPDLTPANLAKVTNLAQALSSLDSKLGAALRGELPGGTAIPMSAMAPMLRGLRELFAELQRWLEEPGRKSFAALDDLIRERLGPRRSGVDDAGYFAGKDGRTFLLFAYPARAEDSAENEVLFTKRVREVVQREKARAIAAGTIDASFEVGVTGMAATVADEYETIQSDMTLVSLGAFFGVMFLLLLSYGFSVRIVIAMVPIILGTLWTFAFAAATIGHLSMLSSVFSAVLFGLGDDFGIHLLARFEEEWARTGDVRKSIETTLVETGPGVITGATTTAIAFYTTLLVELTAFGELGLIAGTGLILVAIAAFLMLPPMFLAWAHLRTRSKRFARLVRVGSERHSFSSALGRGLQRFPKAVVVLAIGLAAFFFSRADGIPFDYNFLKLLPPETESARFHHRLVETSDFSSEFNAIGVKSLRELEEKSAALAKLPTVGRVESVAPLVALARPDGKGIGAAWTAEPSSRMEALSALLPDDQPARLAVLAELRPRLAALPERVPTPPAFEAARVGLALGALAERFDRLLESAPASVSAELGATMRALAALRKRWKEQPAAASARGAAFEQEAFKRLGDALTFVRHGAKPIAAMGPQELLLAGGGMLERLIGKSGEYAIYAFAAGPVWEREFLGRFVAETRSVDPEMTGFPVGFYHFSESIISGFRQATLYAALAILLLLLIEFRGPVNALLAAVPLVFGVATMLGLMQLLGLSFNPANIVALPLVLGMGVEYGVETLHRFAESDGLDVSGVLGTTARAITVAGLTTLLGLGTMALASHQGIYSLGVILVCGIGGCLLASVLVLPALLILIARRRNARRQP